MFIAPRRCGLVHSRGVQCSENSLSQAVGKESSYAKIYMALLRSAIVPGALAINISLLRSEE